MEKTLYNVTIHYPEVFEPVKFGGEGEPRYTCLLGIDKKTGAKTIKELQAAIGEVRKDKKLNGTVVPTDKVCLHEGSDKEKADGTYPEGFHADMMFVSCSNSPQKGKPARQPTVVDRDPKKLLYAKDDKVYGGAIVNAVIQIWPQNNKFGKRINASIETIQWVGEGTRYGTPPVDPTKKFEDISGDDDENP